MGAEADDEIVVLRNPAWWRNLLATAPLLVVTSINLFLGRAPGWIRLAAAIAFVGLIVQFVLARRSRIVVGATGVDLRTGRGRRVRATWSEIDRFAVRGRRGVDVHLTSGRRIAVIRFAPVEDESAASTVALLEYQRRRLGGAAPSRRTGPTR
ncbi:hypothetical protein [Nakamurella sp.]|uniref:hypothetical protein n=1 Tax=Nakamurella sp. TaxID=1869182 RepID=UPI003B3A7476